MSGSGKRVVVTGGAGFIGAHVCKALSEAGADVLVLDDFSTGSTANLEGIGVEVARGTILDPGTVTAACRGADAVVHLAARPSVPRSLQDPLATNEVNVRGTLQVLEAARSVGAQVVLASSSSVYGASLDLPKRETQRASPVSPYAVSKLAAEAYALSYQQCFAVPVFVFRLFNVYGPLQAADHAYAAVVPRFISAALSGRPLEVYGDGQQTRDFTYVGTVATILARAVLRRVAHDGPVNLAFGTRIPLVDLISRLERLVGHPLQVEYQAPRTGDVRDSQADNSLLRSLFARVEATGLEEGLTTTFEWYGARSIAAGHQGPEPVP